MRTMRAYLLAALATTCLAARADAQQAGPYKLQEINFDMWCQEERHLPPERCDKRLPQDDADYQAYVAKIESYEIPYLQHKQDEERLNRVIIHNDPTRDQSPPSMPASAEPPPG